MTASRRPVVAAFDVDGTLTTRDCVTPFLYRTVGLRAALALVRQPVRVSRALARRDRDSIKAVVCTAFAGMDGDERWTLEEPRSRGRSSGGGSDPTRSHDSSNTGSSTTRSFSSPPPSTRISCRSDRASERRQSLCTELERDAEGVLTGGWPGPNCRGPEKVRRLERLARRVRDHRCRHLGVRRLGGRRRASCPRGPSCPGRPSARRCRPALTYDLDNPSQGETPCTNDSTN